ncbi:hypothetical protein B0H10DRAFT_2203818 [Mycena sp. CBHHK59/15]|nr:hypothetical protein B0H10DRAFT_2203818 [Mycena sp. CBHHK59/15]
MEDDLPIWRHLAALPVLTHLCLNNEVPGELVRTIFAESHLHTLVNMWPYDARLRAMEVSQDPPVQDARFVVLMLEDWRNDWDLGARGGDDFWIRADMFIAEKRRGEIEESYYWLDMNRLPVREAESC